MPVPLIPRIGVAVVVVALTALTGCSAPEPPDPNLTKSSTPVTKTSVPDRQPRTLVLKATGKARVTSVKYTLDRKVRRKGKVKLPWRQSLTVPADGKPHSYRVTVSYKGSGSVELVAIFDGTVVGHTYSGGSGSGNVTGNANVSGSITG